MTLRERSQTSFFLLALLLSSLSCSKSSKEREAPPGESVAKAVLKNLAAPNREVPIGQNEEVFDFTALAHNGQRLKLSEFLHKPVFLYFCPQDRADVCTQVALALRDSWLKLNGELSMAFGVSVEDTFMHREFSSEHKLPFLLLADTESSVHRALGVKPGTVMGYLIGQDRRVLQVFPSMDPQALAHALLAGLHAKPAAAATETLPAPSAPGR